MWCVCKKAPSGFKQRNPGGIWVCSRCDQPTIQYFRALTSMLGPNDATCLLSENVRADGVHELRWDTKSGHKTTLTFFPYPRKVGMEDQANLLFKLWEKLDEQVNSIQLLEDGPPKDQAKVKARTLAEVLHLLMAPFYESANDVVREAMLRWDHKTNGLEHETPGLGEKIWDPNSRWDGTPYGIPSTSTPKRTAKRTGKSIPPSSHDSVRQGISAGMFSVSQIAKMYDMSSEEVKEQLGID